MSNYGEPYVTSKAPRVQGNRVLPAPEPLTAARVLNVARESQMDGGIAPRSPSTLQAIDARSVKYAVHQQTVNNQDQSHTQAGTRGNGAVDDLTHL